MVEGLGLEHLINLFIRIMENNIWTLIFSGIVAACTAIYAFLTIRLVRETRLSREYHLEAFMLAYIVNSETSPDVISLVIKNIGNGVARNLRTTIIKDINYQDGNQLTSLGLFNKVFDFFPPNYENKYYILSLAEDDRRINDYIEFDIIYDDAIKKNKKQKFKLEFKDIAGMGKITPPETYIGMISYRLEKIEKILAKKVNK